MGNLKCRASPFPEPQGSIAIAVSVLIRALPTSFTVPSPPIATTMSTPFSAAFLASSVA